jgi:hypothetical protein
MGGAGTLQPGDAGGLQVTPVTKGHHDREDVLATVAETITTAARRTRPGKSEHLDEQTWLTEGFNPVAGGE